MLRKEEVKESALPGREAEVKGYWFDGPTALGDVRITRTQALKLAGLGGAGFLFTLLLPADADARHKRRRRRRRKAQVTSPTVTPIVVVPGLPTVLNLTNPGDSPLTISEVKVLDSDGRVIRTINLPDVTIAPGNTGVITINDPLVDAEGLRLIDARGVPITVIDENGVTVGDIDVA